MKVQNPIFVTEPFLPPLEECLPYFEEIWKSKILTNNGPLIKEFEKKLRSYLEISNISVVNNATSGLMIACKALDLKEEIITTPFSFIATSHVLDWIGLKPVFTDVDPIYGNILPELVMKQITPKTRGILATHNFGFPAKVDELEAISKKFNIPLIFDAAPATGIKFKNKSLLSYGDASVLSFHATKVFTTFEGGAVHSIKKDIHEKINFYRNFSIVDENTVGGPGINAKLNEIQSAIGIVQLNYIEKIIKERKSRYIEYNNQLANIDGISIPPLPDYLEYNFAYYPIYVKNGPETRHNILMKLQAMNIFCRKYWSPLISDQLHYRKSGTYYPNASKLSDGIISLPMGNNVDDKIIKYISNCIKEEV